MELGQWGYIVSNRHKEKTFTFLRHLIHHGFQDSGLHKCITKLRDCILNCVKRSSIVVGKQSFDILTKENPWLNFRNSSCKFKEKRTPSILESALFPCKRESLAWESPSKQIYLTMQRAKINFMYIFLQDIPFGMICPKRVACRLNQLVKQDMLDTGHVHS